MMTEIPMLMKYLEQANLTYDVRKDNFGCEQVHIYDTNGIEFMDAVCNPWSYGHRNGLLELMWHIPNPFDDDAEGWLDGATVALIAAQYVRHNKFMSGMEAEAILNS